ncbi:MAG TPA: peptidoglycan editing factor PgeF [Rhizomicrobium sp.]
MLILRAANLESVTHGFFGRRGGVSQGIYASLNCGPGSKDDPAAVRENRVRIITALSPGAHLVTLSQVHSAEVITVTTPFEKTPSADAMATATPGIMLGILTADCAPVLFADSEAGVIGAAHAGWKGALAGVTDATLAAMEKLGAKRSRIAAAIGPCISQANYEVGAEFAANFTVADPTNAAFFALGPRPGHRLFDLGGYLVRRLQGAGIAAPHRLEACTYARESDFFSFRRATHKGEPDYGREISAITLSA